MLISFICPDKETILIEDCLKQCRFADRCISKPILSYFAEHRRKWNGKTFSTTQLISPTLLEYLKITNDYAEDPQNMGYQLLGLNIHRKMEKITLPEYLQEEFLEDELGTGFMDSYDADEKTLWDYKTVGYYKAKKILDNVDERMQWMLQLNRYKILLSQCGFPVEKMKVQMIIRDSGFMAKKQGIDKSFYIVDIDIMSDNLINEYFKMKKDTLIYCLDNKITPEICPEEERWEDKRCLNYCCVSKYCGYGNSLKIK